MESQVKKTTTYHLVLDSDEAEWLRAIVQNPIGYPYEGEESERDREMRRKVWEALGGSPAR